MSENKEKQPAIFIIRKQELEKQSEAEKETLRKQSAYFPQVISLLKQFKKNFSSTYFSLPSANIRDAFLQQYEISVVQPIIHMDPALFGKEDVHNLHHKHWKYELYIGIPSIIRNGSDMLIQAGVTQ